MDKTKKYYWWIWIIGLSFVFFLMFYVYISWDEQDSFLQGSYEEDRVMIEITFAAGDASWNRAVTYAADMFMEENPDVEIVLFNTSTAVQSDLYIDYLKKQIAVDGLGDIVEIKNEFLFIGTDVLVPLPESLTKLVNCNVSSDGNIYVLPECYGTQGIIYNKDLFEKLGLEEPETYNDFIEICERLKKYRVTPVVVGGSDRWHFGFWMNHFFRTDVLMKNMDWSKECTEGIVSWTDDEPRKMVRDLKLLYDNGYVNEDYLVVRDSETAVLMAEGNVGMLYSGPWMVPNIEKLNEEISLGWFYLPDENGEKCIFLDKSSGWAITSKCSRSPEKYMAAQKFLEFFFSPEIITKICEETNSIPSTVNLLEMDKNSFLDEVQRELRADNSVNTNKQIGDKDAPDNFIRILYDNLPAFLEGELSEDAFLNEMDRAWKDCANGN